MLTMSEGVAKHTPTHPPTHVHTHTRTHAHKRPPTCMAMRPETNRTGYHVAEHEDQVGPVDTHTHTHMLVRERERLIGQTEV